MSLNTQEIQRVSQRADDLRHPSDRADLRIVSPPPLRRRSLPSNVFSVPQTLFHAHEGGAERKVGQSTTSEGVKGSNEFILEAYQGMYSRGTLSTPRGISGHLVGGSEVREREHQIGQVIVRSICHSFPFSYSVVILRPSLMYLFSSHSSPLVRSALACVPPAGISVLYTPLPNTYAVSCQYARGPLTIRYTSEKNQIEYPHPSKSLVAYE
jgi:hypothetical protein